MTAAAAAAFKKLQQAEGDRQRRVREEAAAHQPLLDDEGRPVIVFNIEDLSPRHVRAYYGNYWFRSPSRTNGSDLELGSFRLDAEPGRFRLHIVDFGLHGDLQGRGFGAAAMRELLRRARHAGYNEVVGEVDPAPRGRLSKEQLVEWLRDLGFVVDDAGVATYRLNRN